MRAPSALEILRVGEALEERDEIRAFPAALRSSAWISLRLNGLTRPSPAFGPASMSRPPACVEVDHLGERRDAAVVHVRRGDRDVAQRRRAERAHVGGAVRVRFEPRIGIATGAVDVVEPGVVKHRLRIDDALLTHRARTD